MTWARGSRQRLAVWALLWAFLFVSMNCGGAARAATARPDETADVSYSDPAGDAQRGIGDITSMRVNNDHDWVNFVIKVDTQGTTHGHLTVYVTESRGTPVDFLNQTRGYVDFPRGPLRRYSGSSTEARVVPAAVRGAYNGGVWAVSVRRAELADATRIQFSVHFYDDNPGENKRETDKTKPFGYQIIDYRLVIVGPNTLPVTGPVAGQQFSAAFTIRLLRPDGSPERIGSGDVSCPATVEGRRPRASFEDFYRRKGKSGATCAWQIPTSARGSLFTGTIKVRARGRPVWATSTFRYRVR